jgi:N-acetylglucosaminyl-diphospho-decaprenol L-rhamnosyltransferase
VVAEVASRDGIRRLTVAPMPGSIHIVIVNWNTGDYLGHCLQSIALANSDNVNLARVTVVDNASTDESASRIDDLALPLEVVHNPRNIGFAAACNQGAAGSEADYLLFLNPDTRLFPETLAVVTRFMDGEQAADIGICGAQVIDPAGGPAISCARFPTLSIAFGKMTRLCHVLPGVFPSHHLTAAETSRSRLVDQVIGAFFFVRRALFTRLHGFDTSYFLYYEEVDLTRRALRLGFRSYFLKEARVLHAGSVSAGQVRDLRLYHSLRSRHLYARRNWPRWQAVLLACLTLAVELPARLTMAFLRRSRSELSATVSAYRILAEDLGRRRRWDS